MNFVMLAAAILLAMAGYLSALSLSLIVLSRSALESRAERKGRLEMARWVLARQDAARLAVSLVRTGCRLGFFACILVEFAADTDSGLRIEIRDLVLAGIVSMLLLWLVTVVIASALSRHVSAGLVAGSLPLLKALAIGFQPLTRMFAFVDEVVRRLSGANLREGEEEAQAELLRRIEDTEREGRIDQQAAELLENIVEFNTTTVSEVMTPRTRIDGLEYTDDLAAIRDFIATAGHSRVPVYRENLDSVVGILYVKDLIPFLGRDVEDFRLEPLLRKPIIVPDTKPVADLLTDFQRGEVHMAMVIDEYGGTAGLVTIEDVLEEIVGEIQDEHDTGEEEIPELQTIDEHSSIIAGAYRVDDLNERLGLSIPEDDFDTVAGFVLASMGRVPEPGESFEADGAKFTVLAASPTAIETIRVDIHSRAGSER